MEGTSRSSRNYPAPRRSPGADRRYSRLAVLGLAVVGPALLPAVAGAGPVTPVHGDDRPAVAVSGPAKRVGAWLPPQSWPVVGVHAFVLPTGEVLHYAYSEAEGEPDERRYLDGSHAVVWNPKGGSFFDVSWDGTVFCSGHSFLEDGRLFITGGLKQEVCDTQGLVDTWFLDPFLLEWTRGPDMAKPRYYPTNLTLGDGSVMILSGNNDSCALNGRLEVFFPDKGDNGVIKTFGPGARAMRLYPRVHLLPDGRVVHVGPEELTWVWSPKSKRWSQLETTRMAVQRLEGSSFAVPGRPFEIMACGGYAERNAEPTETCERIDFSKPEPLWMPAPSMRYKRAHANAVLLPDGKVLMVGGGAHDLYVNPEFNPELYDPETDSWTLLPRQRYGRMYHSTAILLPDGRVLSAGQDENPGTPRDSSAWGEIYKPGYMFGSRPKIREAPDSAALGERFEVAVKGAKKVKSVVLMGLSAVTHSVNMGQRYVELKFDRMGKKALEIRVPEEGNLLPPGYYMLFALNKKGRPSPSHMIQITLEPAGEPEPPAR